MAQRERKFQGDENLMRKEFPAKIKMAAWLRSGGKCENTSCGRKLFTGDINYDHDDPDGLTGEPTLENCKVLCRGCHKIKTKSDVARIAKAKRIERRHLGIRKKSKFACSRDTKFKKKVTGEVVLR